MTESTQQKEAFSKTLPDGFYLDPADLDGLRSYLRYMGWLGEGERLESADKAGEGNMNLTLRLSTSRRSFILKQSRPWVEKYPQIEAPESRALVEIAFYETAGRRPALRDAMPKLLGSDPDSRVVALEDLGAARDFTGLYAGGRLCPTSSHFTHLSMKSGEKRRKRTGNGLPIGPCGLSITSTFFACPSPQTMGSI
jgi:5-methylthioribose kinase